MDHSKQAVSIFNKLAKEYQARFMDTSMYHETFDIFCNAITSRNATVLELACGPGNITSYLLEKRPDLIITGTDLAPEMIKLAGNNNPSARFQVLDCREISKLPNKFDAVMCGFVLPYINEIETQQLFKDIYFLLNPDGVFYLSTMEGNYSESGFRKGSTGEEIFMHYYNAKFLKETLSMIGFEISELQRIVTANADGTPTTDLIIISVKRSA